MAKVIALPTAAADPVPRRRWRGRYPKGVVPILRQRVKRKEDEHKRRCQAIRAEREEMEQIERRGVERLRQHLQADSWPFPGIDRSRFDRLSEVQKGEVQYAVRRVITLFEQ